MLSPFLGNRPMSQVVWKGRWACTSQDISPLTGWVGAAIACRSVKTIAVAVALMFISASSWDGSSPAVAQPPGCCEPEPPTP